MTTPTFEDLDETAAVEAEDLDVDVDTSGAEDEAEDTTDASDAKPAAADKPKKEKAPARPPVADGYVTPVDFAKILTDHLAARGASNKNGPISKENPVPPQMVYSYMKNNQGGKNPIPVHTDPSLTGGRNAVLRVDEALAWWDAKDERIGTSKATKAEKEAAREKAKAEKAAAGGAEDITVATEPVGEIEEAE
jgi:hypothetical protein